MLKFYKSFDDRYPTANVEVVVAGVYAIAVRDPSDLLAALRAARRMKGFLVPIERAKTANGEAVRAVLVALRPWGFQAKGSYESVKIGVLNDTGFWPTVDLTGLLRGSAADWYKWMLQGLRSCHTA